jgi:cellobiose phosphorylase
VPSGIFIEHVSKSHFSRKHVPPCLDVLSAFAGKQLHDTLPWLERFRNQSHFEIAAPQSSGKVRWLQMDTLTDPPHSANPAAAKIPSPLSSGPSEAQILGKFIDDGEAFVITQPLRTPRPWANFCFNDQFYFNSDQFGRGMTQVQSGKGEWALNVIAKDESFFTGDKGIYIRDEATGEYWDAGWCYTQKDYDRYEAEMRPGIVKLRHSYRGIEGEWTLFAATDEPVECWELTLSNTGTDSRTLHVFPFEAAEVTGYSVPAGTGAGRADSYTRATIHKKHHAVVCRTQAPFIAFDRYNLMLASDVTPIAYESIAGDFLGVGRQFSHPAALKQPRLSNREAAGHGMIAALQCEVNLAPGETRTLHFIAASVTRNEGDIAELTGRYFGAGGWAKAREAMESRMASLRQAVKLLTPDPYVNALANYWLPTQVSLCGRFSRGWGQGYRDSLQDARALCVLEAPSTEDATGFPFALRILKGCLRTQYASGGTPRKWLPLSREDYSDGPAWLIDAVLTYVNASGDVDFLEAEFPFLDGDPAPVHEHVRRAAAYMLGDRGAHGLVRIRGGDWNDGITGAGKGGEGESVFNTQLLLGNLEGMKECLQHLGDATARAGWEEVIAKAPEVQAALDKHAWDGEYYLRAYDDAGNPVGSHVNKEASIYLEPQAFALVSGSASREQAEALMESVKRHLETPYGCRLLSPSYQKFDPAVGRVSAHVPGTWENGAVYCHATAFYLHGLCRYGMGDKAYDMFLRLTGGNARHPSALSGVEPYAMTNCFAGPENPSQPGTSRFYWYTGVHFGVPRFPSEWKEIGVERLIRGRKYVIQYVRDNSLDEDSVVVTANGETLADGILLDTNAKQTNKLEIRFR